jgi:predicted ATPase
VGRETELARLHDHFRQTVQGQRQVVFITGEVAIGKTALVDAFVAQVTSGRQVWVGRGQCLEQYGAGEPYLPLLEALYRLSQSEV